jgi:hypothetical protein
MSLSSKTFQKLAETLTPEVIEYINNDERYAEFMQEIIPDALREKMGSLEDVLLYELSFYIMDQIFLQCARS